MKNEIDSKAILIRSEVELSCDCLAKAYTLIPKINYGAKQQVATFLFLSYNGLERLLKLILILDYFIENKDFPTIKEMKNKGHDIKTLLTQVYEIAEKRNCSNTDIKKAKDMELIQLISDFAKKERYYNLDNIIEFNPQYENYLPKFYDMLESMYFVNHKRLGIWQIHPEALEAMESVMLIRHTNFDGQPIDSVEKGFMYSQMHVKYMRNLQFEFYKVIRGVVLVLEKIININDKVLEPIRFIYEFWIMLKLDDIIIKKRKTISIYGS